MSDQDLRTFLLGSAVGALLIQRRMLADDLVVISYEGLVLPGIPRIKLWHDAARG